MGTYYRNTEQFLDRIDSGAWVEIGVDRGEGSTQFFADLAGQRGVKFYGVDAHPDQIKQAQNTLGQSGTLPDHIELVHAFGQDFLRSYATSHQGEPISMVYLDNFDWNYWLATPEEPFVPGQRQMYKDVMGTEMNNLNSQLTHLIQAIHLMPLMSDNSIIVCDDTWWEPREGMFLGKCSAALPFLLTQGYQLLHNEGYRNHSRAGAGAILGRFKS